MNPVETLIASLQTGKDPEECIFEFRRSDIVVKLREVFDNHLGYRPKRLFFDFDFSSNPVKIINLQIIDQNYDIIYDSKLYEAVLSAPVWDKVMILGTRFINI
ncbi:hypothetical protein D3C78_19120 [compost metagenome]